MKNNVLANHSFKYKKGVSLISLIITIIVIIILAAIVIFSGLNTPDRANFAKFTQSFSDYNTAIMGDFTKKKTQYAVSGQTRTDAQIYYIIATGNENIVDVNDAPTPVASIEKLGLPVHPEQLEGTEYYEITADSNIEGIYKQMQFYEASEKHYVTDAGEAFTLPGYLVSENGTNRWYINERKYYESDEPIKGPFSFEISEWKLLCTDDELSEEVEGTLGKVVDTAYIYFTATANGEPATISYTPNSGGNTTSETGEIRLPISDNGKYNFTITAVVEGVQKTTTKTITVSDTFIEMTSADAFTYNGGIITGLTDKGKELEELNIPSRTNDANMTSITGIGNNAFQNNTKITSVKIPSSVTSIGQYAFSGCSSLTSITIPSSVTSIGNNVFRRCSSLTSITIPSNVTSIEESTFSECSSLTSITIPSNVTSIGRNAFAYCISLESITLPESVTSIGYSAFSSCTSLESISLPESVTSIDGRAFSSCSNLTSITIPSSVITMGSHIFYNCSSLTNVTFSSGVLSIAYATFNNCSSLNSITIPLSVNTIKGEAFYKCTSLSDVYYAGTKAQWGAINIGGSNSSLTSATIHCTDGDIN